MYQDIKNNHTGPLTIGATTIPKGATARVENWETVSLSFGVKTWLDEGVIETVGKASSKAAPAALPGVTGGGLPGVTDPAGTGGGLPGVDTPTAEDVAKDALIAELASLGGPTRTRKSTLESLQAQIDRAKLDKAGK